jgi:serine O-acetyltransferase
MFETFRQDAARWITPGQIGDPAGVTFKQALKLLWQYMGLRAVAWFRLGTWCKRRRIPFLPGFIQRRILRVYGMEIWIGADIGGGLYVAHPAGTVIAVRRMGRNCSVVASVTFGMRNEWSFPDIGDQVFVGAGARVLGGIRVGDRAVIGANAVVLQEVPDDATAVGVPARVIKIAGRQVSHEPPAA